MQVLSTGLVTSVGLYSAASLAAIRAGIKRFIEIPFHDAAGQPIVGAPVSRLTDGLSGLARYTGLLAPCIRECLLPHPTLRNLAVILNVPEATRTGRPEGLAANILSHVEAAMGLRFHAASLVVEDGRAGGLAALRTAQHILSRGSAEHCLLAGVDSYLQGPALRHYDLRRRLKTQNNSDGFVPGEAGAAVLLSLRNDSDVRLLGVGCAEEAATINSDTPSRADGLTDALRAALADAQVSLRDVHFQISDIAGERYEFREHALAIQRVLRDRKEEFPLWLPAAALGDIGAAAGPCMIAMAAQAFRRGYAPGPTGALFGSSENGLRATALITSGR